VQTTKLIFLVLPFVISGCIVAPLILTGVGAASVAVNETTGKTITDHTVSAVNRQDCKISRSFDNQAVCQDEPLVKTQVTTTGVTPSTVSEIESRYRQ